MLRPRRESDVRSLFGATPEQIRLKQYEDQMAFLNAQESGFGKAGAALGLGLASLFGGKSPEMKQAEARQEVRTDLRDTLALAEQEAAQRGMAPLAQDEVSLLNRRANELQTIAAGFRNLGEDTTQIENAALEARLNALQTKRELENEALRRKASELAIKQGETQLEWAIQDRPMDVAQQQLQFASARNNFTWAQEDRPFVTEANKIQAQFRQAQLASAQGSLKDAEQARNDLEKARTGAIDWLTTNNAEDYVPLVESNIFAPDKAITAALDARKLGITVNEIGPYTLADGTEVIGALTNKGQLVQATDTGWQPLSTQGVIQGRPDGKIKVEAGPVFTDEVLQSALGESPALNKIIDQYVSTPGFFERVTGFDLKDTPDTERRERVVSLIFQEAKRLQKQNPELYSDPVTALRDAASKRIGGTTSTATNTTDRFGAVK
jgi:hypothetical protein